MQIIELKQLCLMLASAIGSFPEFNSKDRNPDTLKTITVDSKIRIIYNVQNPNCRQPLLNTHSLLQCVHSIWLQHKNVLTNNNRIIENIADMLNLCLWFQKQNNQKMQAE